MRDKSDPMELEVQEAIVKIRMEQDNGDIEMAHYNADMAVMELLILLGYDDVYEEWLKVGKWYA